MTPFGRGHGRITQAGVGGLRGCTFALAFALALRFSSLAFFARALGFGLGLRFGFGEQTIFNRLGLPFAVKVIMIFTCWIKTSTWESAFRTAVAVLLADGAAADQLAIFRVRGEAFMLDVACDAALAAPRRPVPTFSGPSVDGA